MVPAATRTPPSPLGVGQKAGISRKVLTYLQTNADRPIPCEEIATELSLTNGQVSGAVSNLKRSYPEHLSSPSAGVHRWASVPKQVQSGETIILQIVRNDGDKMLVIDEFNVLWSLRRVEY